MKLTTTITIAGVLIFGPALAYAQESQNRIALKPSPIVGAWKLNKDLSDKPASQSGRGGERGGDRGGDRGGGGGGGMPPGGMGGTGGRGGGMGRGGVGGASFGGGESNREESARVRNIVADLVKPAAGWTIVQDGAAMIFTNSDGRSMKFTTDNKEELHLTGDGEIKSKSRWNGDQLIIEAKYQDGPKVTRTFTVSSDLRQLMIHIKIEGVGPGGEVTTNHAYDRVQQ